MKSKVNNKFHGISTPEDLKDAWHKLTNRPEEELNVLWNFDGWLVKPKKNETTFNIININPNKQETGHWCLAVLMPDDKVLYYNPIQKQILQKFGYVEQADLPPDKAIDLLSKHYDVLVDLTGEQNPTGKYSSSCGYYCLEKLRDYINQKPIKHYAIISH